MFATTPRLPSFKVNFNFPDGSDVPLELIPTTPDLDQVVDVLATNTTPEVKRSDFLSSGSLAQFPLLPLQESNTGAAMMSGKNSTIKLQENYIDQKVSYNALSRNPALQTLQFPSKLLVKRSREEDHREVQHERVKRVTIEEVLDAPSNSTFNRKAKRRQRNSCTSKQSPANGVRCKRNESSWKVWTKTEEIFLVGAVFELLFERGSLTASNERTEVWDTVKENYDLAWEKYGQYREMLGNRPFDHDEKSCVSIRSAKALYRHYKVLKERVAGNSTNTPPPGTNGQFCFRRYYSAWQVVKTKIFGNFDQTGCADVLADVI